MTGAQDALWRVELEAGPVGLRPLRWRDGRRWREVRERNADWLRPWEATSPLPYADRPPSFGSMVHRMRTEARAGRTIPFAVTYERAFAGQLTVSGIMWGSLRTAFLGYWVDRAVAGRGVMPTAVALAVDHCIKTAGLHRVEINIRPENAASLRVVEKLGFRDEGLRPRYLHIDGDWRDHRSFALCAEDLPPGGLTAHWQATR